MAARCMTKTSSTTCAVHITLVVAFITSYLAHVRLLTRNGELSLISWAYFPEVVRTNEIARLVIIT